ncbi:MAG: O-antigen ligase family protein [Paracoccaceae bacterium]
MLAPSSQAGIVRTGRSRRILAICPNAVLAAAALGGLVWIPVLKTIGAVLFLAAGGLLLVRDVGATVKVLARFWYVLLLPLYCLASSLWSDYPALTFRFSLQLLMTVAIAIVIATRLSPASFHRVLFVVFLSIMAASLAAGNVRGFDGSWLGIFASKNALAAASVIFLVLTTAAAFDRSAPRMLRAVALIGLPVGLVLLVMSKSAGAVLIAGPVLATIPVLVLSRHLTTRQGIATAALALVVFALAGALMLALREQLFAALLETTGKDVTLTGRTDLWRIAFSHISERPFFGLGYQAFWVRTSASAEAIWRMFGIEGRGGFNFHNTYISNAVELGLIGVAIQVFLLYGALLLTAVWAIRSHRAEAACLFALVLMVAFSSFVEVPVFFQFNIATVNVICALVFGVRARTEARRQPVLSA